MKKRKRSKWINTFVRGPKPIGKNFQKEILNALKNNQRGKGDKSGNSN